MTKEYPDGKLVECYDPRVNGWVRVLRGPQSTTVDLLMKTHVRHCLAEKETQAIAGVFGPNDPVGLFMLRKLNAPLLAINEEMQAADVLNLLLRYWSDSYSDVPLGVLTPQDIIWPGGHLFDGVRPDQLYVVVGAHRGRPVDLVRCQLSTFASLLVERKLGTQVAQTMSDGSAWLDATNGIIRWAVISQLETQADHDLWLLAHQVFWSGGLAPLMDPTKREGVVEPLAGFVAELRSNS